MRWGSFEKPPLPQPLTSPHLGFLPSTRASTHRLILVRDACEGRDRGQGKDDAVCWGGWGGNREANAFTVCGEKGNWAPMLREDHLPKKSRVEHASE